MRLSSLTIENFRGIKHTTVKFDRDITVLIGENNTGKTSVLESLRLCLDAIKSDKTCNFSEFDFYRDNERTEISICDPIRITLRFFESEEHPWPAHITDSLDNVIVGRDCAEINLRVTAQFDVTAGVPVQNISFLDDSQNELPGRQQELRNLRKLRPFFFQKALRAAKDQFHSQSTYWASFLANEDIDEASREALESQLDEVYQKIVNAHLTFRDVTKEVNRISSFVAVGNRPDNVSIDPVAADVYKVLRYTDIHLLTTSNAKIPIRSHGEGTQSLSVFLLFAAYLKTRLQTDIFENAEPIVAIEEPEAHLHPNAVRSVWQLLQELPGQKIVATHSGDILSEVPMHQLRKLSRRNDNTQCKSIPEDLLDSNQLRMFNHHVRRNRGELLFARCWILVEGETDVLVFNECANALKFNFHMKGIRIIEFTHARGPDLFIKVADSLGIQWHLIADGDDEGERYTNRAKPLLGDRSERKHVSLLSQPNIEILLCTSGYGQPYLEAVGPQKKAELNGFEVDSLEFWKKVYEILKVTRNFSKPAAAMKAMFSMREQGEAGVPNEVKTILERVEQLAGDSL